MAESGHRMFPAGRVELCLLAAPGRCPAGTRGIGGGSAMTAAFILICSLGFLLMFFVSYCRSLLATSSAEALSQEVREVTGIITTVAPEDFARVVQLLQLCPDRPEERGRIRTVSAYYGFLGVMRATIAAVSPSLKSWADRERAQCGYFAAVVLGRRIAFSRDLLAQQMMP